jgi:hypothetical protein
MIELVWQFVEAAWLKKNEGAEVWTDVVIVYKYNNIYPNYER